LTSEKPPGAGRDVKGRFTDGRGNPAGRPKDVHGIAKLARASAPDVIDRLLVLARGRGSAAVAACKELLDRGLGKAPQSITVSPGDNFSGALFAPDQARDRLQRLIEAAEQAPALPPQNDSVSDLAGDLKSAAEEALPPTENVASEAAVDALPVRSPVDLDRRS
jgi:hypothetical protein